MADEFSQPLQPRDKAEVEQQDANSILNEHREQRRLGEEMINPFDGNRVPVIRQPK